MAKKRKTALKIGEFHVKACAPRWDGQGMEFVSTERSTRKRAVRGAHKKHKTHEILFPTTSCPPTLADRFHSLPTELRAHIFSLLLVTPVKWELDHKENCPLRKNDVNITPRSCSQGLCATHTWWTYWRKCSANPDPWVSPWRSKWAPDYRKQNPYVCSICYDERLRPKPFPQAKSLPCLCARRQNLEVLLVCRRWYLEAAQVFYTQNTFAFEDSTTFIDFISNLPPMWRDKVSKISLMAPLDDVNEDVQAESEKHLNRIWPLLRTLPSLSRLELDAAFLVYADVVHKLIRLGLTNLRQCSFSFAAGPMVGPRMKFGSEEIWPYLARRTLLQGGFAEEVARAIKGQRQRRLKIKGYIKHIIEEAFDQDSPAALGAVARAHQ